MCDYSLHDVASRPARVGDKLITTSFPNAITRGFAAVSEPAVAVCLLPGTELVFEREAECEFGYGFLPNRMVGERLARFRQVNPYDPYVHHDALEFPNGRVVLLTQLTEGQRATVLQLPAGTRAAREGERVIDALLASELALWIRPACAVRSDFFTSVSGPAAPQ